MVRLRKTLAILAQRPEWDLAFLYGRRLDKLPVLSERNIARSGWLWRLLAFWGRTVHASGLWQERLKCSDILFFAGTANQVRALDSSIEACEQLGLAVLKIIKKRSHLAPARREGWLQLRFTLGDLVVGAVVGLLRSRPLLAGLRSIVPEGKAASSKYLDRFFEAYVLLPYFIRMLSTVRPRLVVMSNDHNVANRCLLVAAQANGIKTAYMQHASVSELFPPLEFDYAFLDGKAALELYARCENANCVSGNVSVYMTGQKKVVTLTDKRKDAFRVGIAVNNLDDPVKVAQVVDSFLNKNISVIVRLHPSQRPDFREALASKYGSHPDVELIGAKDEDLDQFLGRCNIIVAGSSSILLEAAIAGVASYYRNMGRVTASKDYYGYVRNGLARPLPSSFQELDSKSVHALAEVPETVIRAVRYYSETFGTTWQGKEGKLVALTIMRLLSREDVADIYRKVPGNGVFAEIFELRD